MVKVANSPLAQLGCPLLPPRWQAALVVGDRGGHALWVTRVDGISDGTVLFCARCGAFTGTDRVIGLARPCPGRATTLGAGVRLRRLKARLHPTLRIPMNLPVRVSSGLAAQRANEDIVGDGEEVAAGAAGQDADLAPSQQLRLRGAR